MEMDSSARRAVADQPARARRLRTVLSCQAPPRAVRTPRSFNAVAMARNVVAPAACIWRTMGSTLAAKASLQLPSLELPKSGIAEGIPNDVMPASDAPNVDALS